MQEKAAKTEIKIEALNRIGILKRESEKLNFISVDLGIYASNNTESIENKTI